MKKTIFSLNDRLTYELTGEFQKAFHLHKFNLEDCLQVEYKYFPALPVEEKPGHRRSRERLEGCL